MIGRHERLERPLRLCVKGRLLVVRQSQEGAERCEIFSPSSRQVLFHIRLVQGREGGELMFGMQHAVFGEPGSAGGRACDVGGGIRGLFNRGLECAAGRKQEQACHAGEGRTSAYLLHVVPPCFQK